MESKEECVTFIDGDIKKVDSKMTLIEAASSIYSTIIGVGIFMSVSPTFQVFTSPSIAMTVIFWTIGSAISIIGALCYAELGQRFPESGGEAIYYQNCLNEKLSFLFIFMLVFVVRPLSLGAIAITASTYLINAVVTPTENVDAIIKAAAFGILVTCCILNCISKKVVQKLAVVFMLLKSTVLLIIIVCGFIYMAKGNTQDWKTSFNLVGFSPAKLGVCFINIFWAFEGWSSIGLMAGEISNPNLNLPLSIFIAVPAVAIMYIFTVIGYCSVLGFDQVRNSSIIGIDFAAVALRKAKIIVPILVFITSLGSVNGYLYGTTEAAVAASKQGMLPKVFSLVYPRTNTSVTTLIFIFTLAVISIFIPFQVLLQYCAFVTWFFYFMSFCALWNVKINPEKCHKLGSESKKGSSSSGFSINYVFILLMQIVCIFVIGMSFYPSMIGCSVIALLMLIAYTSQLIPSNPVGRAMSQFDDNITQKYNEYFQSGK